MALLANRGQEEGEGQTDRGNSEPQVILSETSPLLNWAVKIKPTQDRPSYMFA